MKKESKKLFINRETLRVLKDAELEQVSGGQRAETNEAESCMTMCTPTTDTGGCGTTSITSSGGGASWSGCK